MCYLLYAYLCAKALGLGQITNVVVRDLQVIAFYLCCIMTIRDLLSPKMQALESNILLWRELILHKLLNYLHS